ncbi:MAG: hypothetical protein HUU16_19830 [Candidatus Omnitrophica bacterium]|nr:hypothetical protein [Candidatus Omnitrophota bacterium]
MPPLLDALLVTASVLGAAGYLLVRWWRKRGAGCGCGESAPQPKRVQIQIPKR